MKIAWNLPEIAGNLFSLHIVANAINGRQARVPDCPSMIAPEHFHQLRQSQIGYTRQMGGGVTGIASAAAIAFEQCHTSTLAFQQIRSSDAHDPRTNNGDVNLDI